MYFCLSTLDILINAHINDINGLFVSDENLLL